MHKLLPGHIQHLACASPPMLIQTTMGWEGLSALNTWIWLLTCVNTLVCDQGTFLCETLPTILTTVVTNPQMWLLVCKHGRGLQYLTTEITLHIPVADADTCRGDHPSREVIKLLFWSTSFSHTECIRWTRQLFTTTVQGGLVWRGRHWKWLLTRIQVEIRLLPRSAPSSGHEVKWSWTVHSWNVNSVAGLGYPCNRQRQKMSVEVKNHQNEKWWSQG